MRIGRILPNVGLLLLAIQSPGFADSRGDFPGKGSLDNYNKTCPMCKEANTCSGRGEFQQAIKIEREAISIYPYDSLLYHNLGYDLKSAGQLEEACKAFSRSIELEPTYTDSWLVMGQCFEHLKKLSDAERCYRKASDLAPSAFNAVCSLGDTLRQEGKYSEAKSYLLRAKVLPESAKYPGLVSRLLKLTELHQTEASD